MSFYLNQSLPSPKALAVMTMQTASWPFVADHGVGVRSPGRDTLEGTPMLGEGVGPGSLLLRVCVSVSREPSSGSGQVDGTDPRAEAENGTRAGQMKSKPCW